MGPLEEDESSNIPGGAGEEVNPCFSEKLVTAAESLKNGKAPGHDGIGILNGLLTTRVFPTYHTTTKWKICTFGTHTLPLPHS
ncbi:hypothetical protein JTB14_012615 [Gonioctena quinquepunctata]|nr:hypothetical protein JTB14_012615 [Gonioctena quinquepunctata]